MKNSWNDITVGDLVRIRSIGELQKATDDEKNLRCAALVAGIPYEELLQIPLEDVRKYMDATEFLLHEPEKCRVKRHYFINGRKYVLHKDASDITVAQYIDYQAILPDGFSKMPGETLALMLVPAGHEYNDGYDKEQAISDMYDLSVPEALGIVDFFTRRCLRLMRLAMTASRVKVRLLRMRAPKDQKEMYRALELQLKLLEESFTSGWTA